MSRPSYEAVLIEKLAKEPKGQASPRRLAELLNWPIERVQKVVNATQRSAQLHSGPGGVIQYRGDERNSDNGLYADVNRVIKTYWAARHFDLRNVDVAVTAKGGTRGSGNWRHPDLVIAADPSRRSSRDEPRRLHAIEVETEPGFDIKSVYQAHSQGYGASYSWVFGNLQPGVERRDWDRVIKTATGLGVGVVTFEKAGSFTTWKTWVRAERRIPTPEERAEFIEIALGKRFRDELKV